MAPATRRGLFLAQQMQGRTGGPSPEFLSELSQKWRNLSSHELQDLQVKIEEAKRTNAVNYKAWVESFTPAQVLKAQAARRTLKSKFNFPKKPAKVQLIEDSRLPKRPMNAYSLFNKARWASGDFKFLSLTEASKTVAREWKALSEREKQAFEDLAVSEVTKYRKELAAALEAE